MVRHIASSSLRLTSLFITFVFTMVRHIASLWNMIIRNRLIFKLVSKMAGVHETDNYFAENRKNIDIQKIKRHIKEILDLKSALKEVKSEERSLFTIVISRLDEISFVTKKLQGFISDERYQDAREALTFVLQILENYNRVPVPDNGLIFYTGIVHADDDAKVVIVVEPYRPIYDAFCRISDTFAINALDDLLESEPLYRYSKAYDTLAHVTWREYRRYWHRYRYRTRDPSTFPLDPSTFPLDPSTCTLDPSTWYEYFTLDQSTWDFLVRVYYGYDENKAIYGVGTFKRLRDLKILFVSENLDINCCRVENTTTGKVFTKHLNKDQLQSLEETRELKILEKTPLLDWLAQVNQAKLFGYRLVFVSDTTREGSKFRERDGIGGILRDNDNIRVRNFVLPLVVGLVAYLVTRSTFKLMMNI